MVGTIIERNLRWLIIHPMGPPPLEIHLLLKMSQTYNDPWGKLYGWKKGIGWKSELQEAPLPNLGMVRQNLICSITVLDISVITVYRLLFYTNNSLLFQIDLDKTSLNGVLLFEYFEEFGYIHRIVRLLSMKMSRRLSGKFLCCIITILSAQVIWQTLWIWR